MPDALSPHYVEPRRRLLAGVLALISAVLLAGGAYLATLGGSLYYVVAGLAVAACAYLVARGDARGRWLYALLLIGTAIWAIWECGLSGWGLQARLFAPLVLAVWVFWPQLRRRPVVAIVGVVLAGGAFAWLMLGGADPVMAPSVPAGAFESHGGDWLHFGGDLGGTRYSTLAQITPDNVGQLKEVWRSPTGTVYVGSSQESTTLFVKDTLYLCTPNSIIYAVDAHSGERRWMFDAKGDVPPSSQCRGVSYYAVPNATGPCAERIFFVAADARLIGVDAHDGSLCGGFGEGGTVNLKAGLGNVPRGYWRMSSAPEVIRGNIVVGAKVTPKRACR